MTAAGKTLVLTGKLAQLGRSKASEMILAAGGTVGDHVTKTTDFLAIGADAGSNLEKVKSLGIAVLSEGDLLRLVHTGGGLLTMPAMHFLSKSRYNFLELCTCA